MMFIYFIIKKLLSNSITFKRDKSILYSRITLLILLILTIIAYNKLSLLFSAKGIGIFSGLLYSAASINTFYIFIFLITSAILLLASFCTKKVWLEEFRLPNWGLFTNFITPRGTKFIQYSKMIILIFIFAGILHSMGAYFFFSVVLLTYMVSFFLVILKFVNKFNIQRGLILLVIGLFNVIGYYFLVSKVINQEFIDNYPYLSNIQIYSLYTGISILIFNYIKVKEESTSLIYEKKKPLEVLKRFYIKLKKLYNKTKKNTIVLITTIILLIALFIFTRIVYYYLDTTVSSETFFSLCICIFANLVCSRLILSYISLVISKDINKWYNKINIPIYLLLAVIFSSYIYYFCF